MLLYDCFRMPKCMKLTDLVYIYKVIFAKHAIQ